MSTVKRTQLPSGHHDEPLAILTFEVCFDFELIWRKTAWHEFKQVKSEQACISTCYHRTIIVYNVG